YTYKWNFVINAFVAFQQVFKERRMAMTFYNKDIQYRVTLDTDLNLFVVFDKENTNHVATGVTIEQAVQELKKSA
ncbi:TPA: hypothetical protein ACHAFC_002433, partial [Enterococcus faecium]